MRGTSLKALLISIFFIPMSFGIASSALAANCTVSDPGDSGAAGQLRDCIVNVANDGDTVTIPAGTTVTLATEVAVNKSILVMGAGDGTSIVRGDGGNRLFLVGNAVTSTLVTLEGLTLQEGSTASDGGAIFNDLMSSLALRNCLLTMNNTGGSGGAIFNLGAMLLVHTEVTGNISDANGGGIYTEGILRVVAGSKVNGNNTVPTNNGLGGGIYQDSGTLEILNSEVSGNTADNTGGGINAFDFLVVSDSTVEGNTAFSGGGILIGGEAIVRNSTISNNTALISSGGGGGLWIFNALRATIDGCTFEGNKALDDGDGGAINVESSFAEIANSTVVSNSSEGEGGGIFNRATLSLNNVTVASNTADSDADGGVPGGGGIGTSALGTTVVSNSLIAGNTDNGMGAPDCVNLGIMSVASNNLIQDPTGCTFSGNTSGVLNGDPGLDPNGLQPNGGPTETVALVANSKAINAGVNASCEPTDQRGTVRPQGSACDLGAFEAGPSADLSPTQLVFGEQAVGTTSAAQSATLTNNGSAELIINGIAISGDFSQTNDCGSSVAPGGSCTISGTFTPSDVGVRQGEITVDSSAGIRIVELLGSGVQDGGDGGCSLHSKPSSPVSLLGIALAIAGLFLWKKKAGRSV